MTANPPNWNAETVRNYLNRGRPKRPYQAEMYEIAIRLLKAIGRPIGRFADLGCGSGALGAAVLEAIPTAESVFVDYWQEMLDAAAAGVPEGAKARFIRADFSTRPALADLTPLGPFDAIVSAFAIHHVPMQRRKAFYGEILDLLSPGGVFVNIEHTAMASDWLENIGDHLAVEKMIAAGMPTNGRTFEQCVYDFAHRDDRTENLLLGVDKQCDWLRQLGYVDVDCCFRMMELALFCGRRPT